MHCKNNAEPIQAIDNNENIRKDFRSAFDMSRNCVSDHKYLFTTCTLVTIKYVQPSSNDKLISLYHCQAAWRACIWLAGKMSRIYHGMHYEHGKHFSCHYMFNNNNSNNDNDHASVCVPIRMILQFAETMQCERWMETISPIWHTHRSFQPVKWCHCVQFRSSDASVRHAHRTSYKCQTVYVSNEMHWMLLVVSVLRL